MRQIYKSISLLSLGMGILLMASCNSDRMDDPSTTKNPNEILFRGFTEAEPKVGTRANTSTTNITTTYYGGVGFHIYIDGSNMAGEPKTGLSTYAIPSGYSGTLTPKENKPVLNWFSRNKEHYFCSWTVPWDNDAEPSTEPFEVQFKDTDIRETTSSTASTFAAGSWQNGKVLEQCIGAINGPFQYVVTGQYVPLQFRHLVSKIYLGGFAIVDNATGTSATNLKGNLTIYGLPKTATYYPVNKNADGTYTRPYIAMDPDFNYPKNEGVQFAITNYGRTYYTDSGGYIYNGFTSSSSSTLYDCWYICPEVDFSKLSFKIEIFEYINGQWVKSSKYGSSGDFYGDFSGITFSRSTSGSNYDDYPNTGSDKTILHAGEYIQLSFNLNTKGNPVIKSNIYDWSNTTQSRTAHQHVKPGIFSLIEANEFSSAMNSKDPERLEEMWEMYGSGQNTHDDPNDPNYEDEMNIYKLYEDVGYSGSGTSTTGSSAKLGSTLYVADGYILDGMGHTVNTAYSSLTIGHVRDIYFRYYSSSTTNGITTYTEYIIYIDPNGEVFKVDPVTYRQEPAGYNLNDFDKNPLSLNLSTGRVS